MTRKLVAYKAGVVLDDAAATAEGYAQDSDQARIVSGKFQACGGFDKYSQQTFSDPARGAHAWSDSEANNWFAWGTATQLYVGQGGLEYPITPQRSSGTFGNNPFTTTAGASGATTVTVTLTANGAVNGDAVLIGGAAAFDNVQVGGTSGAYPASNPFTTVSGSKTVYVAHANHGLSTGDTLRVPTCSAVGGITPGGTGSGPFTSTAFLTVEVGQPLVIVTYSGPQLASGEVITISGVASVGGVDPNGRFTVAVTDSTHFVIETASNATSITSGGGASGVYSWVREYVLQVTSSSAYQFDHAFAATSTTTGGGAATYDTAKQYVLTTSGLDAFTITATATGATAGASGGGATARYQFLVNRGNVNGIGNTGYGTNTYGTGLYGLSEPPSVTTAPRVWALDNLGSFLIASYIGGGIYMWQGNKSQRAQILTNAPAQNLWSLVTNENSIMALGVTDTDGEFDPLAYRVSDPLNPNIWLPSLGNNAFESVIGAGSRFVAGRRTKTGIFTWTESGSLFASFTGNPDSLYEMVVIGESAGLLGPLAATEHDGRVAWISAAGIPYEYTGGTPYPMPCLVKSWFRDLLSDGQEYKTFVHFDNKFSTIWFRFASGDTGEVTRYFAVSLLDRTPDGKGGWFVGTSNRTSWIDRGIFPNPLGFGSNGVVYTEDSGNSADGAALTRFVRWAPIDVSDKDSDSNRVMFVRYVGVDGTIYSGSLGATLYGQRNLNGLTQTVQLATITQGNQDLGARIQARRVGLELRSDGNNDNWRLGDIFLDLTPTSRR